MILHALPSRLRLDVQDRFFARLRAPRGLKQAKLDLTLYLRKKRIRLTRRLARRLQASPRRTPSPSSRHLDFRRKNSRNVFARTKRKSAYGQTLLETQKWKAYTGLANHSFRPLYDRHKQNFLSYLEGRPSQTLLHLRLHEDAQASALASRPVPGAISFSWQGGGSSLPRLYPLPRRHAKRKCRIFYQPPTASSFLDLRLGRVQALPTLGRSYPFRLNPNKVLQHYRLRRS